MVRVEVGKEEGGGGGSGGGWEAEEVDEEASIWNEFGERD